MRREDVKEEGKIKEIRERGREELILMIVVYVLHNIHGEKWNCEFNLLVWLLLDMSI